MTTRWKIHTSALDEREHDYTARFECTNLDTGWKVSVTLTQKKGGPASDLVGALTVVARTLQRAAQGDESLDDPPPRLN